MKPIEVPTINVGHPLVKAAQVMAAWDTCIVAVVDERMRALGLITCRDIIRAIASKGPRALYEPVGSHIEHSPLAREGACSTSRAGPLGLCLAVDEILRPVGVEIAGAEAGRLPGSVQYTA